nr:MAG TPA: hypothetical protein [Caudoviricetes sp.]
MDYTHRIWLIFSQMSGLSFGHLYHQSFSLSLLRD